MKFSSRAIIGAVGVASSLMLITTGVCKATFLRGDDSEQEEIENDPADDRGGRKGRELQGVRLRKHTLFGNGGVGVGVSVGVGAGRKETPASQRQKDAAPFANVPVFTSPAVDRAKVEKEDAERDSKGVAPRFAIANTVSITPHEDGLWENLGTGAAVWRFGVKSPGCNSLNFGFTEYHMPEGGKLFIYDPKTGESISRAFTSKDNASHNQLWTPIIKSCNVVMEVNLESAAAQQSLELKLASVNVGYRGFGTTPQGRPRNPNRELAGGCNNDVICPEGDPWRNEIPSVAVISTGGSTFCTGFMVNNAAQDSTPYFMTADHCGITNGNAAELVVYWNYESSSCGGTPNGSLSDFQTGASFRASYGSSDFTLVELDGLPDPAWGVTYAGWDRSGDDATSAVAIHHPNTDEKAISFEYEQTYTTSYSGTSSPGDGTHVRVVDWNDGTTEPGSSGSPLFNQDHRVIGQLHGGSAACGNEDSDWYGKFSVSWTGGGASSSRLSDWLDPLGTGAMNVDTFGGTCGNGVRDPIEECEGLDLNGATCDDFGLSDNTPQGTSLSCTSCTYDKSGCLGCGNGAVEVGEACDIGTTCQDLGFVDGVIVCAADCLSVDTSGCFALELQETNLAESTGNEYHLQNPITLDPTVQTYRVAIEGGSGDADLYTNFGSPPGTRKKDYDCRPYTDANNEQCEHAYENQNLYVMVHAYASFSDVTLKVLKNDPTAIPPTCEDGVWNDNGEEGIDCGGPCPDDCTGAQCSGDAECDDLDVCNGSETCLSGICQDGTPLDCDDGNVCTDDSCDPVSGCVYTNNAAPCDDGSACTVGDTCSGGSCQSGSSLDCDDSNVCTDDSCDPVSGCVYTNNAADCDDGNACTGGDTCSSGVCAGTPPSCDDGNVCTDDGYDVSTCACVYTNNAAPCDDGDACTAGDTCSGGSCQSGGSSLDCDDSNVCTDDSCDAVSGCVNTNVSDGFDCSDGLYCNGAETCQAGTCLAGSNPCPGQLCEEALQQCFSCTPAKDQPSNNDCSDCCGGECYGSGRWVGLCKG